MVNFKVFQSDQRDKACSRARCAMPRVGKRDFKVGSARAKYAFLQVQLSQCRANDFWGEI